MLVHKWLTKNDENTHLLLGSVYVLNLVIAIVGVCSTPKILLQLRFYCESNTSVKKMVNQLYSAVVIVCATINFLCTVFYFSNHNDMLLHYVLLMFLVFIFEVIAIWIIVKDFKISNLPCCLSNRFAMRTIHTLALCHILWFLHRVGCNLLVAVFFIVLAPAQTVAAITLIYSVVVCTIFCTAYNFHHLSEIKCLSYKSWLIPILKIFLSLLLYCSFVSLIILFNHLYDQFAIYGLTSSGLGSIILSLVAPTIVFLITLKLKKKFEKMFKSAYVSHDDITVENTDKNDTTENTPLLINQE